MLKKTFTALALPLLSLLAIGVVTPQWSVSAQPASHTPRSPQRAARCDYSRQDRHVSKDDRRKRKRHHGPRSQRIEWRQFVSRKARHTAIR